MLRNLLVLSTIGLTICINASANASCIDLKQTDTLSFEGTLNYRIFPGPPNFEDVRKGDTPEPSYILVLDMPACFTGGAEIEGTFATRTVHIFVADGKNLVGLQRCASSWVSVSMLRRRTRLALILATIMRQS